MVAVALVTGFVMDTEGKKGGVMKYMFCPGLGNRPSMLKSVKLAMEPESSLPGRPPRDVLKLDGMSVILV